MKRIYLIAPDEKYSGRLIDYLASRSKGDFQFSSYSAVEQLPQDCRKEGADLWIIDKDYWAEGHWTEPKGRIIWITHDAEDTDGFFMYHSAEVLGHMLDQIFSFGKGALCQGVSKLVSLYSPVRRCGQTAFGIHLAHVLAMRGRTLYINLESYSGFEQRAPYHFTKDISDFLYEFTQNPNQFLEHISNYIYPLGKADLLPPVLSPENICPISGETWSAFFHRLLQAGIYDYLLLDIGEAVQGISDILYDSHVIFSSKTEDESARRKWQQYTSLLQSTGKEAVLDKTVFYQIPAVGEEAFSAYEQASGPLMLYAEEKRKEAGL